MAGGLWQQYDPGAVVQIMLATMECRYDRVTVDDRSIVVVGHVKTGVWAVLR